jgi:hypothetical protein
MTSVPDRPEGSHAVTVDHQQAPHLVCAHRAQDLLRAVDGADGDGLVLDQDAEKTGRASGVGAGPDLEVDADEVGGPRTDRIDDDHRAGGVPVRRSRPGR